MQSLFGFGSAANIDFSISDAATRKCKLSTEDAVSGPAKLYIFSAKDNVSGEIKVAVSGGKKLEHAGVRVELKGVVEIDGDKAPHEFCSAVKELAPAGALSGLQALKFTFPEANLPHESYTGIRARVRYFLRAVIVRTGYAASNITRDMEFLVQNPSAPDGTPLALVPGGAAAVAAAPVEPSDVKLEVGIEDCLHIEFQYDRTRLHLADVVTGHIDFLLVRIKIKHMELAIIRREAAGAGPSVSNESETLVRFEVMDGAPIRGERIPLRLFLSGVDLTPTLTGVAGCLNVRYFLNLVLVDEEDRRYFKQQEVLLYRAPAGTPSGVHMVAAQ